MISLEIPGWSACQLEHLVLDPNGTVALDGEMIPGVADQLSVLSAHLSVYLVTADTHGKAKEANRQLGSQLVRVEPRQEASQKEA